MRGLLIVASAVNLHLVSELFATGFAYGGYRSTIYDMHCIM